ncbi:MAG: alpha-glucuronidase family glycosyl hydrolase [Mangrovibacterium sp.]
MKIMLRCLFFFLGIIISAACCANDGSHLWLSSTSSVIKNEILPATVFISKENKQSIVTLEFLQGLRRISGKECQLINDSKNADLIIAHCFSKDVNQLLTNDETDGLGDEGYIIKRINTQCVISGKTSTAILYGVFKYLELLQTNDISASDFQLKEVPIYKNRILNHWDNLDGSVERGYAGRSLWKWDELPATLNHRYVEYARANASVGINGTVLNNVNANPQILTTEYLHKVKALADVFRPYGIKVYLSVNFASPQVIGGLQTASPKNPQVIAWWQAKADEIYGLIPDFGGFLVKANSEGQPGPMDFGCTHAEGANMLAKSLKKYGGIVMWRAFVYNPQGNDRAKQAYDEFMPLDGQFDDNVIVQIKNGPIDFQPREPFSPLFGAMKHTHMMPELQLTQEYLGFSTHLVYLPTLFDEFLQADTYADDVKGTTIIERTTNYEYSAIAGVANIGDDVNWCGYTFAQSNWYAFGRMAWNPKQDVRDIASDWTKLSLTSDAKAVESITSMMMQSREATVNYMTPLGLHHIMGWDHHHGPEPWCYIEGARPDWLPTYYHKADSQGIGFNRSSTGSNATAQYNSPLREMYNSKELCPMKYLLWFHHVDWNHTLFNGNTVWQQMCYQYQFGVDKVREFNQIWEIHKESIDEQLHAEIAMKLKKQLEEAIWWHDACLLYFQTFSNQPFPKGVEEPASQLEDLKKIKFDLKHQN